MKKISTVLLMSLLLYLSFVKFSIAAVQPFSDINAGIEGFDTSTIAWGDYNNDGFLDLVISGTEYLTTPLKIYLYKNNGNNTFTRLDNTNLVPVQMGKVGWVDYDKDGYKDLVVQGLSSFYLPSSAKTEIYHNNHGDGTFTDINANILGAFDSDFSWGDYDNDGYPDLLVAGQTGKNPPIPQVFTKIYHNNGNGTFTDINASILPVASSSVAWLDFNNDGRQDVLISGFIRMPSGLSEYKTKLYRNDAPGPDGKWQFTEVSIVGGI